MDYIGEHLLPGQLGNFFIVLSLVASGLATFSFFKSAQAYSLSDQQSWKKLGRIAFLLDCISVFAVFAILYFIVKTHLFEYKYAWQHSSRSLEPKYLLAAIWEGQEGSFLLWAFWHCILGILIISKKRIWEAPVMTTISFVQFCLATMVIGMYVFDAKIGSNPFILLRDSGVLDNAPALHINFDLSQPLRPDYLSTITDGNDLNPLLQNYWMVIHPPVLFLGFASTIVPFAFAVAGLWKKQFSTWINDALPWALFSLAILGLGIMMGAAWAYESLTFGGYWAWDPVENASLVPWMILVAGIHTLLIYKHSGYSLRPTYVFFFLTFIFILYSTFLTRSGILGDSSVHAFTDLGMNKQLYLFLFAFIWPVAVIGGANRQQKMILAAVGIGLLIFASLVSWPWVAFITLVIGVCIPVYHIQKQIAGTTKEESASSREFWMYIGALVFFLSGMVIIGKTSLPVVNKIFNTNLAAPEDVEFAYNQIQIFSAIIIALLTGATQYFKYKNTSTAYFRKKIAIPFIIAIVFATLVLWLGNINYDKYGIGFLIAIWMAVACSIFAIVANASYIWIGLKGKLKISGGSISHFGFGLVLLGILLSSAKKEILSINTSGIAVPFGEESNEKTGENLTLVKNMPVQMGKYDVTYISDSTHPKKEQWYFNIHFKSRVDDEDFYLMPNAFVNYKGNEGLMANPDSRHYLTHDVFTYVSALADPELNKDTARFVSHEVGIGDSIYYSNGYMILEKLMTRDSLPFEGFSMQDQATVATLKVYSMNRTSYTSEALLINKNGASVSLPDTVMSESLVLQLEKSDNEKATIGVKESNSVLQYVTLKAYKFPFINMLWAGILITVIGILMSMLQRSRRKRQTA